MDCNAPIIIIALYGTEGDDGTARQNPKENRGRRCGATAAAGGRLGDFGQNGVSHRHERKTLREMRGGRAAFRAFARGANDLCGRRISARGQQRRLRAISVQFQRRAGGRAARRAACRGRGDLSPGAGRASSRMARGRGGAKKTAGRSADGACFGAARSARSAVL